MIIPSSIRAGIFLTVCAFGCIGNLLVVLVVASKRRLATMHFFLLASLSLSHFLFHIIVIFPAISLILEQWSFGTLWCKGSFYLMQSLTYTTILLLCAVTWECHTAVVTPYDYSNEITVKKITVVVLLWIASFVFVAAPFLGWGKFVYNDKLHRCEQHFENNNNGITNLFARLIFFIIPSGLITKQQYQIHRIEKHKKSLIVQQFVAADFNSPEGQRQKRLIKSIKVSKDALIIVLTFLASYLPACITFILRAKLPESDALRNTLFWAVLISQIGSALNPIIYCFRKRQFRRQFLKFLGIKTFTRVVPLNTANC